MRACGVHLWACWSCPRYTAANTRLCLAALAPRPQPLLANTLWTLLGEQALPPALHRRGRERALCRQLRAKVRHRPALLQHGLYSRPTRLGGSSNSLRRKTPQTRALPSIQLSPPHSNTPDASDEALHRRCRQAGTHASMHTQSLTQLAYKIARGVFQVMREFPCGVHCGKRKGDAASTPARQRACHVFSARVDQESHAWQKKSGRLVRPRAAEALSKLCRIKTGKPLQLAVGPRCRAI